ncbi:hypothetical protein [Goodfellowiella coeruleoviolacea]|uniref:Uncharacterized protein n=1 Tax=Goodfellowiella coeruleoviolacea TaxID=334858 RepID=A0AAE3KGX8_9PSEU|nr:hypothetical protein [Goodfellowiella coeruleoviolacea]MCP2166700.1 hypothetical protein [Goodfellowiella coeruleoviolacea]
MGIRSAGSYAVKRKGGKQQAIAQSGLSEEEYQEAKRIAASNKTWWDVIKENAGDIIGDLIGYNDVRDCFTKLDLWACAGLIPWGRLFKLAKSAYKIFEAVRAADRWIETLNAVRGLQSQRTAHGTSINP